MRIVNHRNSSATPAVVSTNKWHHKRAVLFADDNTNAIHQAEWNNTEFYCVQRSFFDYSECAVYKPLSDGGGNGTEETEWAIIAATLGMFAFPFARQSVHLAAVELRGRASHKPAVNTGLSLVEMTSRTFCNRIAAVVTDHDCVSVWCSSNSISRSAF